MDQCTVQSLRDAVDAAIAKSGETIVGRVTGHYVDAEIDRRAKLIVAGVEAVRAAELDVKKVDKPDIVHMNAEGAVAAEHYSKGKFEEVKKVKERLERLTTALNNALAAHTPDTYKKLDETIKKSGRGSDGNE